MRDSVLRGCRNDGLSVGSNVVNGKGPTRNISVDVDRTTITGNRGGNLGIRNFTGLRRTWWGRPAGPGILRTLVLGGTLDTALPLASRPEHCAS